MKIERGTKRTNNNDKLLKSLNIYLWYREVERNYSKHRRFMESRANRNALFAQLIEKLSLSKYRRCMKSRANRNAFHTIN